MGEGVKLGGVVVALLELALAPDDTARVPAVVLWLLVMAIVALRKSESTGGGVMEQKPPDAHLSVDSFLVPRGPGRPLPAPPVEPKTPDASQAHAEIRIKLAWLVMEGARLDNFTKEFWTGRDCDWWPRKPISRSQWQRIRQNLILHGWAYEDVKANRRLRLAADPQTILRAYAIRLDRYGYPMLFRGDWSAPHLSALII